MKNKKIYGIFYLILLTIILSATFISAGFWNNFISGNSIKENTREFKCFFKGAVGEDHKCSYSGTSCSSNTGECTGSVITGTRNTMPFRSDCANAGVINARVTRFGEQMIVEFDCRKFVLANFLCHDGLSFNAENPTKIHPNVWTKIARESCNQHCSKGAPRKCGVDSLTYPEELS